MYSKKVLDHFSHPRNQGEIKNADGVGKVGNPVCGDMMYIYIKVGADKDKGPIIKDLKWQTFGCAAAIANTSILSENVKGMTISEAEKLDKKQVLEWIGEVPKQKIHCSILADEGLQAAIKDYKIRCEKKCSTGVCPSKCCDVGSSSAKALQNAIGDYKTRKKPESKTKKIQ